MSRAKCLPGKSLPGLLKRALRKVLLLLARLRKAPQKSVSCRRMRSPLLHKIRSHGGGAVSGNFCLGCQGANVNHEIRCTVSSLVREAIYSILKRTLWINPHSSMEPVREGGFLARSTLDLEAAAQVADPLLHRTQTEMARK